MVQLQPALLNVRDFIDRYGDDSRYELIDGELIDLEPTGFHEQVAGFIGRKLNVAIDRQDEPYLIPYRCLIKLLGTETAFRPDIIAIDPSPTGTRTVVASRTCYLPRRIGQACRGKSSAATGKTITRARLKIMPCLAFPNIGS